MRNKLLVTIGLVLAAACLAWPARAASVPNAANAPADPGIAATMDSAVESFRKIIVLMDGASALDEGNRERVATAGRILFEQNVESLGGLGERLDTELKNKNTGGVAAFLERLEKNADYRDADKLVFRDLTEQLAADAKEENAAPELQRQIAADVGALEQIQALYQKEITQIFGALQSRGMEVHREAWQHYLAGLKAKYQREAILKELETKLPAAETRGGGKKKNKLEMFGTELPPKTLVLTFDDGPHPRYTDQVLAILKKYGIQAVFFEVGKNLGTLDEKNEVKLGRSAPASYHVLESGSSIGNHSYSHPVLPKMDEAGYTKEIDSTNTLLAYILKGEPVLFRPPYGASNEGILTKIQTDKMKTIIWNIDSEDWADPVPNSIAQRVVADVEKQGRGIILFHDIHKRTLEVLPQVIEALQGDGYKFVSWNGSGFGAPETRGGQETAAAPLNVAPPYRESWAAVIGIDAYDNWQKLRYAANDAQGVRDMLIAKYNFKPDHIFMLLNKDATRGKILSLLGDKLANADLVKHEDRVFVFYAGHGATRKLASGRELGYIIPVDADLTNYEGTAISMTNFQDIAEAIPAKHLLFVMDSCYSGLALTRGGGIGASRNYLTEIARRSARQMFTAGGADQQVADNGPNGHSVFTWTLLQALDGRGDLNGDGVITASELAAYVAPAVSALSHQTPTFGNLPGSEGGDFIFDLKHETEFLNENSAQLGDDAIKVNAELEKLRSEMRAEARKNEDLRKQLAAAQAQLKQGGAAGTTTTAAAAPVAAGAATAGAAMAPGTLTNDAAAALNDEGMRLYKEKKYLDAAEKFSEASKLQPASALFANNAGFAYFKMEKYDDAVKWFQQTIALDPRRSVAYLNLGDAYWQLQKKPEAADAYKKFLAIAPGSKAAPGVQEKLKALESKP
jgi:peptidoglycan/xylan/chitin deacetylase (PgdA/CDA1 family)/TolA-binding protein